MKFTQDGERDSDIAFFGNGIANWSAEWICAQNSNQYVKNFKNKFSVSGEVKEARLYICGLGYFNARLNRKPVDDTYYKPLVTDYATRYHPDNCYLHESSSHRVTYYAYDVTEFLKDGDNELSVDVANGYYYNTDRLPFELNYSFDRPKLIFELHITEEGRKRVIKSGTDTLVKEQNYASTLYMGDFIDFTKEEADYEPSVLAEAPDGKPAAPQCEDDRVREVLSPISEGIIKEGMMYDFGINHTGGLKLLVEAEEGDELIIRYAEVLGEDGLPNYETSAWHDKHPYTGQTIDIYQENRYILKKGINEITPLFSWYCYRYAVLVKPDTTKIHDIKSLFICTDVEQNGHFECSEEILNRTNEMFIQTLLCNMHSGLVTDCPHREKRPYTGDAQITMKASWYNLDTTSFYYKWFEDLLDAQTAEGLIPNSAPDIGGGGGYAWGNAICFATKYLYQFTGDKALARKGYRAIEKWLSYYQTKRDEDYIIRSNHHEWMLGDWLAPGIVVSNIYYINTVCYLMAVDAAIFLAEQFAVADLRKWKQLRESIVAGIHKVFFDKSSLSYGNGVQGEDVLALATGIVPKEYENALREKVEHHYREETDYHLDTGIVLTPILIEYLTEHGYTDIAYRIMTAKTYPSYYNLMENDTTFSEHWSKKWPDYYVGDSNSRLIKGGGDVSHCHPMYGSVCSWLYERVAGIDLTGLWKKEVGIHPYFTNCLSWSKADKIIPYGKVSIDWENGNEGLRLLVNIPKGLTGICSFPSKYKKLKCLSTGEIINVEEDGYFRFEIQEGEWTFRGIPAEQRRSCMTIKEYIEKNLPLSIRYNPEDNGALIGIPYPYIIPSVADMFQEMYYWDSYFANAGLLILGDVEQAKNNVDNLRHLLDRYGFVLNGNNVGFEHNSQPPFLALMIRELYDVTRNKEWLKEAYESLKKEYKFWTERRTGENGLTHYDCEPLPPEKVQSGVRDLVGRIGYKPEATDEEIARGNFSTGESGWDFNPRMRHETYKYTPADLNSLIYSQLDQLAYFAEELGLDAEQEQWIAKRERQAALCREYLKGEDGVFYDYHLEKQERTSIVSAACFYPLYVGMATEEEAKAVLGILPRVEMEHGIAACEQCDVPGNFQWGYPNGWPPMQRIVVEGLLQYGYKEDAMRIAKKYVELVEKCFEQTGHFWEKYNVEQGNVEVVDEYKMPAMLGWTFGVYYGFCKLLGKEPQ